MVPGEVLRNFKCTEIGNARGPRYNAKLRMTIWRKIEASCAIVAALSGIAVILDLLTKSSGSDGFSIRLVLVLVSLLNGGLIALAANFLFVIVARVCRMGSIPR